MARGFADGIDEDLESLEEYLKRLRVEYEQYFSGNRNREPTELRARAQKVITRLVNEPPRNTGQRFRFNQLNARFQSMRQRWGRVMREISAGTYAPQQFRADLHDQERLEPASRPEVEPVPESTAAPDTAAAVDRLCDALASARRKTGEHAPLDRDRVARLVAEQTAAIRERHPGARIKFRVVVEGNRAKLKASISA